MSQNNLSRKLTRRGFLKLGGGALAAAAGAYLVPQALAAANRVLQSARGAAAPLAANPLDARYHLMVTDGWVYLPPKPGGTGFHPDPWAPAPFNTYTFGFRDVTGLSDAAVRQEKGKVQLNSPVVYATEGGELRITLTNLGFAQRPDLTDGHTVHFHGFPNAIPAFDGVPELSVGVPFGRSYTYYYRLHDPGTYMYHCHFEDIEHVSMGMTGSIFVRPADNPKWAYKDAATAFDREFALLLGEVWTTERFNAAHIQEHDWSEYDPDYWTINGRVYPDTLEPNTDPLTVPARPELQYQPNSSLITCNAGEKVLLRWANLGFQRQAMKVDGLALTIVGKDAKYLGPTAAQPADRRYTTDSIDISPGESFDALFTAPAHSGVGAYDTYLFYNRKLAYLNNAGMPGYGGQMTEIRVYPGTLPPQPAPNF
mgnify:CR=1 FL=1